MIDSFLLTDKKIIITGASSGIGRQCAISCSQMGAEVILIARNLDRLEETLCQMSGTGHELIVFDLTNYSEIKGMVSGIVARHGKIDGLVHCAGIDLLKPLAAMKAIDYEKIFAVNVISGFELAKIIAKSKYSNSHASIVFLASVMATEGASGKIAYCASKSALISSVKSMALELAKRSIRVNSISPSVTLTEMVEKIHENLEPEEIQSIKDKHPLGFGEPKDIANTAIFLLSSASKWITGTNIIVDGGYSAS